MIRVVMLALLGLASFAAVYVVMGPRMLAPSAPEVATTAESVPPPKVGTAETQMASVEDTTRPDKPEPMTFEMRPSAEHADETPQAPKPQAETVAAAPVRDVTPTNMTEPPAVSGPLTRVAPAKPPEQTKPRFEARTERLFNPVVETAGAFRTDAGYVRLAGVTAPDPDARCGKGESAWPCGTMARAALRRFVRGRAIECDVPAGSDHVPDPSTCRVGGEDIGAWLVATGWAKRTGDHYRKEENAARQAKLGMWSAARPDDQAEVAASD